MQFRIRRNRREFEIFKGFFNATAFPTKIPDKKIAQFFKNSTLENNSVATDLRNLIAGTLMRISLDSPPTEQWRNITTVSSQAGDSFDELGQLLVGEENVIDDWTRRRDVESGEDDLDEDAQTTWDTMKNFLNILGVALLLPFSALAVIVETQYLTTEFLAENVTLYQSISSLKRSETVAMSMFVIIILFYYIVINTISAYAILLGIIAYMLVGPTSAEIMKDYHNYTIRNRRSCPPNRQLDPKQSYFKQ